MAKKNKQHSQKSLKKTLIKEIESKLGEVVKDYHKKISEKKFGKELRKVGKILSRSLAKEHITIAHKEKIKTPKKDKKVAENEVAAK
jgi:hypothetical protein